MTFSNPFFRRLTCITESYMEASEQRKTIRALSGLSNQSLKDLGMNRSEIISVAAASPDRRRRG